jgi:hypothetical protein
MKICNYGCNKEAKFQLKNGKWCCSQSQNSCPENMRRRNESNNEGKGYWFNKKNPDHSIRMTGENNPNFGKFKEYKIRKCVNPDCNKVIKKRSKNYCSYHCAMIMKNKSPDFIENHRKLMSKQNKNLEFIVKRNDAIRKARKNPEERLKRSKNQKERWKDPEYIKKQIEASYIKPNKLELQFEKFLNELYLGEWKYVGDFEFWLGGKNPDFMNVNGQKKLIELYGDYWHRDDNPQDRIDHFKQYGFDTLILWESELKDLNKIKNKIQKLICN